MNSALASGQQSGDGRRHAVDGAYGDRFRALHRIAAHMSIDILGRGRRDSMAPRPYGSRRTSSVAQHNITPFVPICYLFYIVLVAFPSRISIRTPEFAYSA